MELFISDFKSLQRILKDFRGIYLDEYNFMKTIHFSKTAKQVVLELEGVSSDNDHFMSLYIVMDELENHPEGALQISGLPE